jgi:Family of unknown function (DUF6491)
MILRGHSLFEPKIAEVLMKDRNHSMKRSIQAVCLLAFSGFAAGSCASYPDARDSERLALYRHHAGQPVKGFQYYGRFSHWTSLGDSAVAIWVGPGRAWLLDLYGPCNDLDFAHAISLTSTGSRVNARFDSVRVIGRGLPAIPCRIKEIRPVDVKALRAEEKTLRQSRKHSEAQPSGT